MLTTVRTYRRLPPDWAKRRYEQFNRAIKVTAIVHHLLREQFVHSADQATDAVIIAAARDIAAGSKLPSPTTCQAVRDTIAALITVPMPDTSDKDAMEQIHQLLNGQGWDGNTFEQLASIVRSTGRTIADTDH
ncbi:hypothetical protein ABTX81_30370 [Kitasatospora sp. NPDC097605]|uniref:hypothetical protein n=1 Tax=Kitasatospora sp. NPDC097605 TaxID=3157226 RepID=UPI003329CA66